MSVGAGQFGDSFPSLLLLARAPAMTCSICHEEHPPVKFEVGGVKVYAECPTTLTILIAGVDGAMGFTEAESLFPEGIPLRVFHEGGENASGAWWREPTLEAIVRKVRWWVLGAGAFGCVVGFTVGAVL